MRGACRLTYAVSRMRNLLLALLHLAVITAKLCGPGGVRAVIAENLLLKQQLIVLRRARQRAPNLTLSDRLIYGLESLFLGPERIRKIAIGVRLPRSWRFIGRSCVQETPPSHRAVPRKPGPKGPSEALIQAIVELKSRNPRFGCPRMRASSRTRSGSNRQERRLPRAVETLSPRPGWPRAVMVVVHRTHERQPVERGPLSMRVHRAPELLGARGHGPIHASPRRSRRAPRCGQWRRHLPDVQRRHSWSGRTATSRYRS